MQAAGSSELTLSDCLRVVRQRKWVVAVFVLVSVAIAVVATTRQTAVYQAQAKVLLQEPGTNLLFDPNGSQRSDPARMVQTEIQLLGSEPIRNAARQALGGLADVEVSGRPVGATDFMEIRARSASAKRAAAASTAFANAYVEFRRQQQIDDLQAASTQVGGKLADLQKDIEARLSSSDSRGTTSRVDPQLDSLVQQQTTLKERLDQLKIAAALKTNGSLLVTPATVPTSPDTPDMKTNVALGLTVGALLGLAAAFVSEYLDHSIKSARDLMESTDVPVLAIVPRAPIPKRGTDRRVVVQRAPGSAAAEAYRSLRTSVQHLSAEPAQVLQFTSPLPGDGKTTTVANLAVLLAQAGHRVVLVDCDLRRPRAHEAFGLSNEVGFTSVVSGKAPLSLAVKPIRAEKHLFVVAAGPVPARPSELLSSDRAGQVLRELSRNGTIVLVDSSPVLPITDACVLAPHVDGVVLVVASGVTTREQAARAVGMLRHMDVPILGSVLNGASPKSGELYLSSYPYHDVPAAASSLPSGPGDAPDQWAPERPVEVRSVSGPEVVGRRVASARRRRTGS